VFDFRLLLIKVKHHPAVRAWVEIPDRIDDAMLGFVGRSAARLRPFWNSLLTRWRLIRDVLLERTAPARRVAAGWGRKGAHGLQRVPLSCWFGFLMTAMLVVPARLVPGGVKALCEWLGLLQAQLGVLPAGSVDFPIRFALMLSVLLIVLLPAASLLAFMRKRAALLLLKAGTAGFLLLTFFLFHLAVTVPGLLNAGNSEVYPNTVRNELWVTGASHVLPWMGLALFMVVILALLPVRVFYGSAADETPRWADRLWQNLRSHGSDPGFRKALYISSSLHIFFIFILPMLAWWGCNELPYGVPQGSGTPVIESIKVKKLKKKPEKRYVLNMNSAISFYQPKIEDSEVLEVVDKQTENTYEAQQLGKLGAGGGKTGGWPNGMKNSRIRFIRLEYEGGDWNQDMGYNADYNFLIKFRELTGFDIASETESRPIAQLKRFPKNRAPPFVYMTGGLNGTISLSNNEIKILREYCLNMGGLLFADNGGGNFDRNFRPLMKRVFPELPLIEISLDDAIFQQPFSFPGGAPRLWHHSGDRAMGVKYKGRWVVFYHQGDINDAWKAGHSGATPEVAAQAYKLGVNVVNYAFNQYMSLNFDGVVPK
jgi:hypothetical protein